MTVETEVAALTTAVDKLTTSVDVSKSTLDAKVATAASSITSAEAHKNSTNTLKTETGALKDLAVSAASSASTDAANAYQDLTAIAESKSETATDVFVYDTSKDSDGGAWRNRTQGTSWYNEALNTSTRGATKKFPAVAVIVAEEHKVTIYDGDDPSMPMWMEFIGATNGTLHNAYLYALGNRFTTCITMKDGVCYIGTDQTGGSGTGFMSWHFIEDTAYNRSSTLSKHTKPIAQRNENENNMGYINLGIADTGIVNNTVNDIAVTVLPNAPIDPDTGLPVPTIAVATDGGVSVIKDNGNVVDITGQAQGIDKVAFTKDNKIACHYNFQSELALYDIPETDILFSGRLVEYFPKTNTSAGNHPRILTGSFDGLAQLKDDFAIGSAAGICQMSGLGEKDNALINYTTRNYNTGWMNGDIKLATLMDTTAETISPTELVDNGDFSTTSDWTFPNGDGSISNGQATVTATTDSNKYIRQDLGNSLVSGRTYAITFNLVSETGTGLAYARLAGVDVQSPGTFNTGVQTHYITYTGGSPELRFMTYANSGAGFTIDDVSITEVVADRSVNNNGLNIVGNITKEAVATGAELVGYSGISSTNYLQQPYNSDLDFGTGDFSVLVWIKSADTFGIIVDRWDANETGQRFRVDLHQGKFRFRDNNSWVMEGIGGGFDDNLWHCLVMTRKDGVLSQYVDGKLVGSVTDTNDYTNTSAPLNVGVISNTQTGGLSGNLALLRISATAPTAEQIAKIYRDEKPLFQEGAKCTLYGDSDSINALAYDEDTGILHAGTTGGGDSLRGRSDFKGLQRVNNTTYGIAVALSAANGLVVSE